MAYELEKLLAKQFIARQDVMAQQITSIAYQPLHRSWTRADITDHLKGVKTYGHYLVNADSECKLFCLDIDIKQGEGYWPHMPMPQTDDDVAKWEHSFMKVKLRDAWLNRRFAGRDFVKMQLRTIAGFAAKYIWEDLQIPCAVASSGSKGIHVYGFTGLGPAVDAREAGMLVLELMGNWKLSKGNSTFDCVDTNHLTGFPNFDIEVYPKQDTLGEGQLGNLLRLPLGVNRKATKNPTFFLDLRAPMTQWIELDPLRALSGADPWSD